MNTYPSMKPFRPLGTLFAFLFATILKIEHEKEYDKHDFVQYYLLIGLLFLNHITISYELLIIHYLKDDYFMLNTHPRPTIGN